MNIASLVEVKTNPNIPHLAPGDTVRVHTKIVEGEKERTQVFQGTVIKLRRGRAGVSFTVRHVAYGVGVERTFPSASPLVEKVEVIRHGKVRRAKLYYLRALSGKASRIKEKRIEKEAEGVEPPAPEPLPQAQAEQPVPPEASPPAQPEAKETAQREVKPPAQPEAEQSAQPEAKQPVSSEVQPPASPEAAPQPPSEAPKA